MTLTMLISKVGELRIVKALKFPEKNSVDGAGFGKGTTCYFCGEKAVTWQPGTCAKSAGCERYTLLSPVFPTGTLGT